MVKHYSKLEWFLPIPFVLLLSALMSSFISGRFIADDIFGMTVIGVPVAYGLLYMIHR